MHAKCENGIVKSDRRFISHRRYCGYFVGYLIKKLMHLAFTIGVFIFLLMYMLHVDAIDLNFEGLGATITGYADVLLDRLGFAALVSSTPFVGSFVVGLVLGLRRG